MKVLRKSNPQLDTVYDIEVEQNHNFVLANGTIAHNCSHSTSYAIVAYNGAWLKYHYPLHFWKGILEINTDDFAELNNIMRECGHLIADVDARISDAAEWRIFEDKLYPPLSMIKGCGIGNIEKVVSALVAMGDRK